MAKTIRYYHLKGRKGLKHWDALLKGWLRAHETFCRIYKDDPAYWYTEIPNVSILGATAWRCGRIALQEFRAIKKRGKKAKVGRADLWICTDTDRTGTDWKEELIEAKHKFVSLSGHKDKDGLPTAIKNSMDEATKAAEEAQGSQDNVTALAVVFASAYAPESSIDKIDCLIKEFCERIKSSADYHALAWCFPKETRKLQNKKGYYHPGIAMLVKNIKYDCS